MIFLIGSIFCRVYYNYYNDGYHQQFWHQLLFTATELASAIVVFSLIDREASEVTSRKMLVVMRSN